MAHHSYRQHPELVPLSLLWSALLTIGLLLVPLLDIVTARYRLPMQRLLSVAQLTIVISCVQASFILGAASSSLFTNTAAETKRNERKFDSIRFDSIDESLSSHQLPTVTV